MIVSIRKYIVIVTVIFLVIPRYIRGEIVRRPFVNDPYHEVLSRSSLADLTELRWGNVIEIFELPVSMCLMDHAGVTCNLRYLFFLDKVDCRIRHFELWDDWSGGDDRWLKYIQEYGGRSSRIFYKPSAIDADCGNFDDDPLVTPDYKLYIADSGNNRIVKLDYDQFQEYQRISHEMYIGEGILNDPRDVSFCDLPGDENDFIIVADTGNNRIILFSTNGAVLQEMGGPGAGSGIYQFDAPLTVTAMRINQTVGSKAAWIYVGDTRNERIVKIERNDIGDLSWIKSYNMVNSHIASIDVDDNHYGGLFVADRIGRKLEFISLSLDHLLDNYEGLNWPIEVSAHEGYIGIVEQYTSDSGMQLFELVPEIIDAYVSPTVFVPPLEWVKIIFSNSSFGEITIEIYDGETLIENVCGGSGGDPLLPDQYFYYWDGVDEEGDPFPPGTYTVKITFNESYGSDYDVAEVPVEISENQNLVVLNSGLHLIDPQWSPDEESITYSRVIDEASEHGVYLFNLIDSTEVLLTDQDYSARQPSWAPDGHEIVWRKTEFAGRNYATHAVNMETHEIRRISQVVDYVWEDHPRYTPDGNQISFIGTGYNYSNLYTMNASDGSNRERLIARNIVYHDWSPNADFIVYNVNIAPWTHVWRYDMFTGVEKPLTYPGDYGSGNNYEQFVACSPNGEELLFVSFDYETYEEWRWDFFLMHSNGSIKRPIVGLGSELTSYSSGLDWSPDNTKLLFPLRSSISDPNIINLICADVYRGDEAYPSASITLPLTCATIGDVVAIIGTVSDNISVTGVDTLSELIEYRVEYGESANPEKWFADGVQLAKDCAVCDCRISNDTLALWNTGILQSGIYTLRLIASDGQNSNVIYRPVHVLHNTYIVQQDGSGDFTTIQSAIDATKMGDTVLVYSGDYHENLIMRETIRLVGAEDGVRIIGGNDTAMRITNHTYPCEIKNIAVYNDNYYLFGRGIYIYGASPTFKECQIKHNGSENCGLGGGVLIGGDSYPKFIDCVISQNKSFSGGGIKIDGYPSSTPAPSFVDCQFTFNEATVGGAIYLYYDDEFPLDTTYTQPAFSGCVFSNNRCKDYGAVIASYNCHALLLRGCEISSNEIVYNEGETIYGFHAGARIENCTIVHNEVETGKPVIYLGWSQLPYAGLSLVKSITAFNNADPLIDNTDFYVRSNCFYQNSDADQIWSERGINNFIADPAFCNPNGEYTLYSYSPCALGFSTTGQIGAYGIGCVPSCDTLELRNNSLFVCPAGDWDSMVVVVDLSDSEMFRDIERTEIQLIPPLWESCNGVRLLCLEPIFADSTASNENGWHTTITHNCISVCGNDSLNVLLDGLPLGKVHVAVKSPDYNGDGLVNLSDLSHLGLTYNKCPGDSSYNACFDFAGDNCIRIHDLVYFSNHYLHEFPDPNPQMMYSSDIAISEMEVNISIKREIAEKHCVVNVDISFENIKDLQVLCLVLEIGNSELTFSEWQPDFEFPLITAATIVNKHGRRLLFIYAFGHNNPANAAFLEIGRLEFNVNTDTNIPLGKIDFPIFIGEYMTSDGKIWKIKNVGTQHIEDEELLLKDYLYSNYPNPFNPSTVITYSITRNTHVSLSIYNVNGQLVRLFVDEYQKPKLYTVTWDGKDNRGRNVDSGVYFYRLKTDYFEKCNKLILLR